MILDNDSLHTDYKELLPSLRTEMASENCSSSNITGRLGSCSNTTSSILYDVIDFDAFAYIFVVLSFYAVSMVLLMIKYIRREEEEVCLSYYYTEFVKREKFQNPIFKNKVALENATTSGLIEKALQLLHTNETYLCVQESEGKSPEQSSHLDSSVSCDLPSDISSSRSSVSHDLEAHTPSTLRDQLADTNSSSSPSASRDLPEDLSPLSENRVYSSEDDDDILCAPCPDDNLLETIV